VQLHYQGEQEIHKKFGVENLMERDCFGNYAMDNRLLNENGNEPLDYETELNNYQLFQTLH
jgi:hypothetical protein